MVTIRGSGGGHPGWSRTPGRWARPPGLLLGALAVVALIQAGCQSGGCGGCGISGIGSKLTNGVQALGSRVFHHKDNAIVGGVSGGCCGSGGIVEGGEIIEGGIPVSPGVPVVPGGLIPPPVDSGTTELKPLDPGASAAPTSSTSTPSSPPPQSRNIPTGGSRGTYEANRRAAPQRRYGDVARAVHTPTGSAGGVSPAGSTNALDHLPPVDHPPVDLSPAVKLPESAPTPGESHLVPTLDGRPAAAPATESISGAEAASAVAPIPVLAAPVSAAGSPGIARSNAVEPRLMGGSLPTAEGLDWLKQRGYKTLLDLRGRTEVDPAFVDSVSDRGMVYVALPILANRLDSDRLARFDDLVSQSGHRPLYFCDADGTRAGLMWYLHRITVDRYDPQTAATEAEEMGLNPSGLKQADAFLAQRVNGPHNRPAPAPVPAATPAPAHAPAPAPAPAPKTAAVEPTPAPVVAPAPAPAPIAVAVAVATPAPTPAPAPIADAAPIPAPTPVAQAAPAAEAPAEPALPASDLANQPAPAAEPEPAPAPVAASEPDPAPAPTPAADEAATGGDVLRPQASHRKRAPMFDAKSVRPIAGLVLAAIGLPLAYWSRSALSVARHSRASRRARERRSLEAPPASDA